MNSILKFTALAASMAVASAQTYPNGTAQVGAVAGYSYLGCYSLNAAGFTTLQSSTAMTDELCASFSASFPFFAVSGTICLGGNAINSTVPVGQEQCNTRCPGNPLEICGGQSTTAAKRQVVNNFYSVYERSAIAAGTVVNQVITNVYVDVNLNLGTFQTVTAVSTAAITGCGCASQSIPTIACSATTLYCSSCPTPGPVTVTAPVGVTAGAAAAATVTVPAAAAAATAGAAAGASAAGAAAGASAAAAAAATGANAEAAASASAAAAAAATGTKTYTGAAAQNVVGGAAVLGAIAVLAL